MKMSGEMFEGEDYPTQWALNPAAYQNMNSDQVDWAALAQQWIKMKETSIPPAPPPPSIANEFQCLSSNNGGGEAPMDMDTKDDDIPPAPPAPNISGTEGWNQWNQWGGNQWNQNTTTPGNWEWNNSIPPGLDGKSVGIQNVPSNVIIPPPAPTISSASPPFPNHCNQSNAVQSAVPIPPSFGYSTMPLPPSQFSNQVSPNTFWNSEHPHPAAPGANVPGCGQPPPFIKGLRQNSNRIPLVPTSASTLTTAEMVTPRNREIRDRTPEDDFSSTLDTVKRRQLPAWIREGLEKMEREKQKAVERERQEILRKQELEARKKIEDQARAVLNPSRSKFDSDSEKEATEHEYDDDNKVSSNSNEDKQSPKESSEQHSPDLMRPRKTRFRDADSPIVQTRAAAPIHKEKSPDDTPVVVAAPLRQNKEEMLQNLMLKVRRSLTEILLEVTNDEISSVCKEVWKRYCSKASTGHSLITSSHTAAPVAQITRKLGLGIYGDSNSESDEEHISNHEHSQQSPGDNDSEDELKETLRRRQQAFRKTEAEIEARLAEEEDEEDEDRVKVKRSGEQDEADNLRKKMEGSSRDDLSSREKDVRNDGSGRGMERRLKKDSGMGNTSGSKTVDTEVERVYDNERKSSEVQSSISKGSTSKSTAGDNTRLVDGNNSSSSESADHYNSSKRTAHSSKSKNSKSSSRKKLSRYGENAKDGSSSRSRSRSRNVYSSREGSYVSSRSSGKPEAVSALVNRTSGDGFGIDSGNASNSRNRASNKRVKNHMHKSSEKQYVNSKSRSSSHSDNNRSRSRSRSHSRSTTRSRSHRTKRSRSRSGSRRRRRSRVRQRSRSHSPTRTRTRSRSRSRYRSRSRRRSRSSYSHKSRGTSKKRDTRSRSVDRSRRSRSNTRSSKSHYYRHRHHYRQDRDGKKSTHRYED